MFFLRNDQQLFLNGTILTAFDFLLSIEIKFRVINR